MDTLTVRNYPPPPIDRREILRYAGARGDLGALDPHTKKLLDECLSEMEGQCVFRVCAREFPLSFDDGMLDLSFMKTDSRDLKKHLFGCSHAVLFAATVGLSVDRLIARYGRVAPTKALFFQAIGAERIESLCNLFFTELAEEKRKENAVLRPRFSAGYGDFPLAAQREIFAALDCARKIGLSLNQSLLMSPAKSVTALIGIENN